MGNTYKNGTSTKNSRVRDGKNTEKKLGKLKSFGPEATGCSQLPRKKHSQHKNKEVKNM
jgi:hypothetical protein